MPKNTDNLSTLHRAFVEARPDESRRNCREMDRKHSRQIQRLARQGVSTVGDLIERLPTLSPSLQELGIWLISVLDIRQAKKSLLKLLLDERVRCQAASTLAFHCPGKTVEREFLKHGWREMNSPTPDRKWLEAVVQGLTFTDTREGTELLVTIFERLDLPGWLRGDAADKLGGTGLADDRRTRLYRRARDAALRGLTEDDIEVQFWSMYLLLSLAKRSGIETLRLDNDLAPALPRLKQIAAKEHRLAPGFWWPMSAEAEDAIACIETGRWPDLDAGDRWSHNTERGAMNRD